MNVQILILGAVGFVFLLMAVRAVRLRSVTQYGPAEVRDRMEKQKGILLLDVRTRQEREARHIPGSLHIPLHEIRNRMEELRPHQGQEIICYCQSGNRSLSAAYVLQKGGYRAASMRGGILDWDMTRQHVEGE